MNPAKTGTKAAAHYVLEVPAGGCEVVRLRLSAGSAGEPSGRRSTRSSGSASLDADEFYERIVPSLR